MASTVTTVSGETVDLICRRHYGDESGYAEAVYDANRGLAALGPVLPGGLVIVLPEVAVPTRLPTIVQLWE